MDFSFLSFLNPSFWIKIITIIAIFFYVIFTLVVFTQVKVMGQILSLPHADIILKTISVINIILGISLFLIAIVIL
ncbi:MAG: hypothetical protein HY424_03400 [Candidatus Levybacteria bacterium]|nr:hypothetical protein [Candidatus Levybacteria bacterium]